MSQPSQTLVHVLTTIFQSKTQLAGEKNCLPENCLTKGGLDGSSVTWRSTLPTVTRVCNI